MFPRANARLRETFDRSCQAERTTRCCRLESTFRFVSWYFTAWRPGTQGRQRSFSWHCQVFGREVVEVKAVGALVVGLRARCKVSSSFFTGSLFEGSKLMPVGVREVLEIERARDAADKASTW